MYGSPEPSHQSYDDWSPAESWRAAEDRASRRARAPRLTQGVREPAFRLPHLSTRHLRYVAWALALAFAAIFLSRAAGLAHRAFSWVSHHAAAAAGEPTKKRQRLETKTFAWVPVAGARAYAVEFAHDGRVIYLSRTRQPRLKLPALWTYRGRRHGLRPGAYHWYVWPILRTANGSHRGRASVSSTLTIPG